MSAAGPWMTEVRQLKEEKEKLVTFLNACLTNDKFTRIVHLNILARDTKAKLTK